MRAFDESAYPQHGWSSNPEVMEQMLNQGGLTKHEYAAIHIAAGMMGDPNVRLETADQFQAVASQAVRLASFIFEELSHK